jgi:hypothetical protein
MPEESSFVNQPVIYGFLPTMVSDNGTRLMASGQNTSYSYQGWLAVGCASRSSRVHVSSRIRTGNVQALAGLDYVQQSSWPTLDSHATIRTQAPKKT